jgi:hypothetical protein
MELSNPSQKTCRPLWRRPGTWYAAAGLLLYAILILGNINACAGGSDSSGYLNHARLLASGRVHVPVRAIQGLPPDRAPSYLYMPLGFKPAPHGDGIVPTYPPGLPLLVAAAAPFAGWDRACDLVIVIHSLLGLLLVFALGRSFGLEPAWALLGAVIAAASPLYLTYSLQAMSDVPALAWTTAAILAAWRSSRTQAGVRSGGWALAAGAAFAMAVLIRPTNILALAPLLIALGLSVRRLSFFVLGGLPGAVFFALHSLAAYGHPLATGYGDATVLFDATFVGPTLVHYLRWLPALFTPVVFLVAALPWAGGAARRPAAIMGSWTVAYLAFYCSYYCTHETWWYLRFVLPAAPALVVGGLLVAHRWAAAGKPAAWSSGRRRLVFASALIAILAFESFWSRKLDALSVGRGEATYPMCAEWLRQHLPKDAVVVAMQESGSIFYYTDFTFVRWDQMQGPDARRVIEVCASAHRPVYASLFDWETDDALRKRMPGAWSRIGEVRNVTIWRLDGS